MFQQLVFVFAGRRVPSLPRFSAGPGIVPSGVASLQSNGFPCGIPKHTKTETKLLKLFQIQCLCSTKNSNSFMQISECTEIEINWIMFSN